MKSKIQINLSDLLLSEFSKPFTEGTRRSAKKISIKFDTETRLNINAFINCSTILIRTKGKFPWFIKSIFFIFLGF